MHKYSIAFDFDGTIINVAHRDYAIYCKLVSDLSGLTLPFERYWSMRRARTDIHLILSQSGISEKNDVNTFLQQRAEMIEDEKYLALDTVIPGVKEAIMLNRTLFSPYLVTTRNYVERLYWQIGKLGLTTVFDNIIVARKQKTDAYSKVNHLKIIVGDTENDIDAANALCVVSIGVLSGIRNAATIQMFHPQFIADSVATIDFKHILMNIAGWIW